MTQLQLKIWNNKIKKNDKTDEIMNTLRKVREKRKMELSKQVCIDNANFSAMKQILNLNLIEDEKSEYCKKKKQI